LFRFNNYPLGEKACSVMFHIAGLSLRDVSEKYHVTMASTYKALVTIASTIIHLRYGILR